MWLMSTTPCATRHHTLYCWAVIGFRKRIFIAATATSLAAAEFKRTCKSPERVKVERA